MNRNADFVFLFHQERREKFRNGELSGDWLTRYPELFDPDDARILKTEHQRKYHFLEWLSAVLIYESTGYFSLVENYSAKNHPRKFRLLSELVPEEVFDFLVSTPSGHPDLFLFHPETGDWFFAEVKGPTDTLKNSQLAMHERLETMTRRAVKVIQLDELKS